MFHTNDIFLFNSLPLFFFTFFTVRYLVEMRIGAVAPHFPCPTPFLSGVKTVFYNGVLYWPSYGPGLFADALES